jgi:septal ring factor EnvC (AmiA/AmiB activator)
MARRSAPRFVPKCALAMKPREPGPRSRRIGGGGLAILALTLALAVSLPAQQPGGGASTEADRAADRLKALHAEADRLAGEARTLLGDLRRLEIARAIARAELGQVDADIEAARADLAALDDEVRRIEAENEADLPQLRRRLVEIYKLGQAPYLRLLLSTTDLRRVGHASRTAAMLAESDRDRVATRRPHLDTLASTRATLVAREQQLGALRREAARAAGAALRAVEERNALLRQVDERRDLTAQLAGELQIARQNLERTLGALPAGAVAAGSGLPIAPFRGDLDWPVDGPLRRRFGGPAQSGPTSNGIEIVAEEGAHVHAVHDGLVVFAEPFTGFGNLVIVRHETRNFTLYGHLLDISVARGSPVLRGQAIGSVGLSPAGQAGLYFEIRIDARPVDPLQWLRAR